MGEDFKSLLKAGLAEFTALFFFVFVAVGAAVSTSNNFTNPGPLTTAVALSFGFTLFTLCFTFGHISGGHINPAVTLAFLITRKITLPRAIIYWICQILGGMLGGGFLVAVLPEQYRHTDETHTTACFGSNQLGVNVTEGQAFFLEFVLTFFLLFIIGAAVDTAKNESSQTLVPLAIGFAVSVAHFIAIPITGTSLNPARSFASAIISTKYGAHCEHIWDHHWIFWFAPLLGGSVGLLYYDFLFSESHGGNLIMQYRRDLGVAPQRAKPGDEAAADIAE